MYVFHRDMYFRCSNFMNSTIYLNKHKSYLGTRIIVPRILRFLKFMYGMWSVVEFLKKCCAIGSSWPDFLSMAPFVCGPGLTELFSLSPLCVMCIYSDGQQIRGSFLLTNRIQPFVLRYKDESETERVINLRSQDLRFITRTQND